MAVNNKKKETNKLEAVCKSQDQNINTHDMERSK